MTRFQLRFPGSDDLDAVYEAVRESIEELHRWMPWCHRGYSLADAAAWIASQEDGRKAGTAFEFLIVGENQRILGCCGLNGINPMHHMANLGYWVRTSEVRRGVASRATKEVAEWAFANTELVRLEIVAAVGNSASQSVAVRAGASREGVLHSRLFIGGKYHDAVMHSLIRPSSGSVRPA